MGEKLYNVIFPMYLLSTFVPFTAVFFLIGNLIIDSAVILIISYIIFKKINKDFYKNTILKIWLFGYLADCISAAFLGVSGELGYYYKENHLKGGILYNIAYKFYSCDVEIIILGIIVASLFIFVFNYFISFRKIEITKNQKLLAAIILAITTSPYTFLIPT